MVNILLIAVVLAIPIIIGCVFTKIYNIIMGIISYFVFSFLLLKILRAIDPVFIESIGATNAVSSYKILFDFMFVNLAKAFFNAISNETLSAILTNKWLQYLLAFMLFIVCWVFSAIIKSKKKNKNRRKNLERGTQ